MLRKCANINGTQNRLLLRRNLHNTDAFFRDLTGKNFCNLAYKLHFLHTDLPILHKRLCFSTTIPPSSIYLECFPTQCVIKNKQRNISSNKQQPSSQDLCVNIVHTRSTTLRCVRKYIKFVKVYFQVLLNDTLLLNAKIIKT